MLPTGYKASPDKLTYTINLRNNVKFHDGSTMTVNDLVASIKRWDEESWELDGSIFFPQQETLYTTKGTEHYLDYDVAKAKRLMKEAGYNGELIRIRVTNLYPDHYNGGQIMAEQLKKVGFNIDLQVMDWPTLVSRREEEDAYEAYIIVFGGGGNFDPTSVIFFNPAVVPNSWVTHIGLTCGCGTRDSLRPAPKAPKAWRWSTQ